MSKLGILFIEDDASGREMGVFNLEKAGYRVDAAEDGKSGLALFTPAKHALVITDLKMPGLSGMEVLKSIKSSAPDVPVLVITAYASVERAVDAMKLGAFDFIGKPFNRDHLLLTVEKALKTANLTKEVTALRIKTGGVERPIVARSKAMKQLLEVADRVALSDATVLITGESGTGKELVARRIHVKSARGGKPFVAVNAAAMPGELLESELFGHEKGAFTGATNARAGRFRQADKGTLFLDEIADLASPLQAKLLRVLQERTVEVVGSDTPIPVDIRILAATHRNLKERVARGLFREDLFYRLNVVEIALPALRDRLEDIDDLVPHFVEKYADGRELGVPGDLLSLLKSRPWPGNVRELENICQRLVILCRDTVLSPDDMPDDSDLMPRPDALGGEWPVLPEEGLSLIDLERQVIERVLGLQDGNVSRAAAYLKIPRHVLAYRMEKYGLSKKRG
jgi:DNA-binding NtrC family response regulator